MTKTKRFLSIIFSIAVLCSTLFISCGVEKTISSDATSVSSISTAKNSTNSTLPEVTLTWYVLSNAQPDDALVYSEANKYIKEKINATVDFYPLNMGEYSDKIRVKLAGQESIDIVFTSSWLNSYSDNIAMGAIMSLDELLDKYGTDLKSSIPKKYWDMVRLKKTSDDNAKIYGVPNYQIEASVNGLAFRKDLAQKYNLIDDINNVKNYDDLTPILKIIKENEPNIFPLIDANLTPEGKYDLTTEPYQYENIAPATSVDTKTFKVIGIDDPISKTNETKLGLIRRDWFLKGYINQNAVTVNVDVDTYKKQGKVFLYQLGACKPGVEIEEKAKYGFDIITKQTRAAITSVGQVTTTLNAIPSSSVNPDRAMMLLNLVNTDKYLYNLLNFGIENIHYIKSDTTTIEVLKNSKFNPGMAWALGNQFNAFVQKGQPKDVWEQTKKINENAKSSPIDGFSFNAEPVKTELAQMNTVGIKYDKIILNGAVDPIVTIEKRNKELNISNNLKKVVAEAQRQLDAWRAANGK
jgi:putative aldouronate transport system substrate-binding protein